jgi:PAS domain S-box-containing protein
MVRPAWQPQSRTLPSSKPTTPERSEGSGCAGLEQDALVRRRCPPYGSSVVGSNPPPPASGPKAPAPPPQPDTRPLGRVLIVDDNTELVGTLHAVLVGPTVAVGRSLPSRLEVVSASRGEEALAIARAQGFDVAIVDVKLPDASGVDLIKPLRDASPFGEVVLITGFASMDAAIGALRSGAFALVLKSFRPEELISTVEQALTKVRLKRDREELERRYRAIAQLTDVLVVAVDAESRVVLWNRKATALSGVPAAVAKGRDLALGWIPPEDRSRLREAIVQARSGGRTSEAETGFISESDRPTPGDRTSSPPVPRRVRWHLSGTKARGAEEDLVYGIGIDVTERRALEKRAADAEALSAMGRLALNLAHEIRNPLNAAVLQLHLLGRDIDKLAIPEGASQALHKRAEIVGDEIGRLNRLLTEFLELARPRGMARGPVHVGKLVDDVLDLERDTAAAHGVTIVRDVASDGCVAIADGEKLKQVVINLVVNAIEAMKEGGTLTAKVTCTSGHVEISIEDTGVGIAPEHLANLFDPFFTTKEGGTGLGLSIVRKIVDQHAGEVQVDSERGRGTRVRVRIPTGR